MADRPNVLPYKRKEIALNTVNITQGEDINKQIALGNKEKILVLSIIAFLLGRAGILDGLTPFGLGFFATVIQTQKKYAVLAFPIFLGIISTQGFFTSIPYGIALGVIYLLLIYIIKNNNKNTATTALLTASSYTTTGFLFLNIKGFFLYDLMMILFEAFICFVIVYITSYALPIALHKNKRKLLSTEEIICVTILAALIISGIKEIYILNISIKNLLGILVTIIFAYNGGASIGAAVGITLGLITSLSTLGMPPVVIGIYGFSGLLSGIFKEIGKVGSAFGFLMGNAILTFYISGYYERFINFKEIIAAFVLFICIPKLWLEQLEKFSTNVKEINQSNTNHSERIKKIMHERLMEFSDAFEELSATFQGIAEKQEILPQEELSELIEKTANSICAECGMKARCWDKNFYSTYQAMMDIIIHIETNAQISKDDLPIEIVKRCIHIKRLIEKMSHLHEVSHLNISWKNRLVEGRGLVGQQLKGVSEVIERLGRELKKEMEFDPSVEEDIYIALDKAGLSVNNVIVIDKLDIPTEITIEKKSCFGRDSCTQKYIPVISKCIGEKLVRKKTYCNSSKNKGGCCRITLVPAKEYTISTKVAKVTKEGNSNSGDSYTFLELKNNQYMMAISDGMGTGEKANIQSNATISMLEKMIEAGFDKEIAIRTINSMLMLKSSEEMFSTIDMAMIDLQRGKTDFVKIGSSPSFIKRKDGKIEHIHSSTLPIGILTKVQIDESIQNIEDGDIIIMLSDGILEANKDDVNWIKKFIENIQTKNPQDIADKILQKALEYTKNKAEDDMTVLVSKIWKVRD